LEAAGFRYNLGADVSQERPPMFKGQNTSNEALAVGREAQQTVQAQRSIPTMGGAAGERRGKSL